MSELTVGDWVKCERESDRNDEEPFGTWARYAGRKGRLVTINRVTPEGVDPRFEYGVLFANSHAETITWFMSNELIKTNPPRNAPNIRTAAERPRRSKTDS